MILPSASKVALALRCTLPWHSSMMPWPREKKHEAAAKGDAVHGVADDHATGNAEPTEYEGGRTAEEVVRVAFDELTQGALAYEERPITYNPKTGKARMLPKPEKGKHRDYSLVQDGELVGTADLIVVRPGEVTVLDYKTGRNARKKAARDTWQMRMLAVALAALLGAETVRVGLVHVDDGDYWVDWATFDFFDLEGYADELRKMVEAIESGSLDANMGPHCGQFYCPIRTKCPATKAALVRAEQRALVRLPVLKPIETDEEAASWHTGIKLLEEFVRSAKDEVHNYARRSPVELEPGLWLGAVEKEGHEKFNLQKPGALDAVIATAGAEVVDYRVTKKAIEDTLRGKQKKRGDGGRKAKELYAKLREMGALETGGKYTVVEEFRRDLPEVIDASGEDAA